MQITAQQLAQLLKGEIVGDPTVTVSKPAKIEEATSGTITFFANAKYEAFVYDTKASILLVNRDFQPKKAISPTLIKVDDVYASIAQLLQQFGQVNDGPNEISEMSSVSKEATLGENIAIGEFAVIQKGVSIGDNVVIYPQVFIGKNAKIGDNTIIYPGVKIYHECEIGNNCILQANVVIGGDGFGFAPNPDGSYSKIPQIGNVIIENDVEIGANTTIDRAAMGSTRIKKGTKLDNLLMIAHGAEIGQNTVIAAQTGVAGSTKIGDNCQIGGQVGFVGHITVANGTKIQAQSGVARKILKEGTAVYGSPAIPYSDYLRAYAVFKNLPELAKKVSDLEKKKG